MKSKLKGHFWLIFVSDKIQWIQANSDIYIILSYQDSEKEIIKKKYWDKI